MRQNLQTDGGPDVEKSPRTIRVEMMDRPGELLTALKPISINGGNLLAIHHERGKKTPKGQIPVEIDFEATTQDYESIVKSLRGVGYTVTEHSRAQYAGEFIFLLIGNVIENNLIDIVQHIEAQDGVAVENVSLIPNQKDRSSSTARFVLATQEEREREISDSIRSITDEMNLRMIEPITEENS